MLRQAGGCKNIFNAAVFLWSTLLFALIAHAGPVGAIASEAEMQMQQAAEAGDERSYLMCAKILESAPSTNRFALVAALDAGMEAHREKTGDLNELVLPEPLKKQLIEMWSVDSFNPALIRVLARSGSPAAYSRAGFIANEKAHPAPVRLVMINLLGESRRPEALQSLIKVIGSSSIALIREAGLEAMRHFTSDAAARGILKAYHLMTEGLRYRARDVLFSRKEWSQMFFEELNAKKIFAGEIPTEQLQKIAAFDDVRMNSQITNRWGLIRNIPDKKQAAVLQLKKMLSEKNGDPVKGGKAFDQHCAQCHSLFSADQKLGPHLAEVRRSNTEFLLSSLVDPDAFVRKKFLVYDLEKTDGVSAKGIMIVQNADYVVLQTVQGERSALRDKIKSLQPLETSLMPDDLWKVLAPDELSDLFAYLQSENPATQAK